MCVKWSSGGGERASAVLHFDRTLSRLITAGIHHHAPPHIKTFFLPTGCTIRSLLSGLGSGGCKGSKKWALSLWIMPLFQLLWPGMPNFTARYSSLCVNQSFARDRGARWVRPQPRMIRSDQRSPSNQILQAHSGLSGATQVRSVRISHHDSSRL